MADLTLPQRLAAVFDDLGIRRAHIATQMAGDIGGFVTSHADRIAGLCLLAPARINPAPFVRFGNRLLYIAPDGGTLSRTAANALPQLPGVLSAQLSGYEAESWTDLATDRPEIAGLIGDHLLGIDGADRRDGEEQSGEVAGIRYRKMGRGPVLVLMPMALSPNQWEPILPALAEHFCVVSLAGPKLGMLALLEERAALADWRRMCAGLFDDLALPPGGNVLDVGCGSGAVAMQFMHHFGGKNALTALDLSPYLLGEARYAAEKAGVSITLRQGSAEELPFDDNAFDAAYSITVLEECNAETALAELRRVVKPGGRVAVVVRGTDLHAWWNMPVPPDIRAKFSLPAQSVSPDGVATARIYSLGLAAGFKPVRMGTYTVSSERTDGPVFAQPETYALSLLSPQEQDAYRAAKEEALAAGTLFMTRGHHCFVGEVT